MEKIKIIGRGGQGGKTLSYLIALGAFKQGFEVQAFPDYGPEREGAPVFSYTRISDKPILVHFGIKQPDYVVVIDSSLISELDVLEGMKPNGIVILNCENISDEFIKRVKKRKLKLFFVNATQISIDELGVNMPNTPMLGAFTKVYGKIYFNQVENEFKEEFSKKLNKKIVDKNLKAMKRAFNEVKEF